MVIVPICESVACTSRTKNNGRMGWLNAMAEVYTNFFTAKDWKARSLRIRAR